MRAKKIKEGGKSYLVVSVNPKITYAFVSKTGKSWVFRVDGEYLKSNGETIGAEGRMTGYISKPFGFEVDEINSKHYHKSDIVKFDFDGLLLPAVKVQIFSTP